MSESQWERIEINDVSELDPKREYEIEIGGNSYPVELRLGGWFVSKGSDVAALWQFIRFGCPIYRKRIDEEQTHPWTFIGKAFPNGGRTSVGHLPWIPEIHGRMFQITEIRHGESVMVLREGDVLLRKGEYEQVISYTGSGFHTVRPREQPFVAYVVLEEGQE